jgi:hypothetical protein
MLVCDGLFGIFEIVCVNRNFGKKRKLAPSINNLTTVSE